jgi:hypothetical protein
MDQKSWEELRDSNKVCYLYKGMFIFLVHAVGLGAFILLQASGVN